MKRAYFTIVWERGTPMLDACLDVSDADPDDVSYLAVCKRLKTTDTARFKEVEARVGRIAHSLYGIQIRMRLNPHHEGPFIVYADADVLSREVLDNMVAHYHRTGELDDWLNRARVKNPVQARAG